MDRVRDLAVSAMGIGSASLGVEESGESDLLRHLGLRWSARAELVVVDVGGFTGDYAAAVRSALGPKAKVHCFEPNPALFAALGPRLRGDAGITCHQVALGGESGTAELFLDQAGSSCGSLIRDSFDVTGRPIAQTHEVAVKTLDQISEELGLTRIDLLKLDVEGHELTVLHGARGLLDRDAIEVVQFEFGERNIASRTFFRDFVELLGPRYSFFRVTPRGLVHIDYRPKVEIFALETNYVALSGATPALIT